MIALDQMTPIGLDDMKAVRLMNRVDQKTFKYCRRHGTDGR